MKKLNSKKSVIGFDLDGVILDNSAIKVGVAQKLGFNLKPHHTHYDIMKTILPQIVLEELEKLIYSTPEFVISTPLIKGAKAILSDLNKKDIPVFLVSRRIMPEIPIQILSKHGLWPRFFNEKNSFFVNHAEGKKEKAAELGLTHFIDDELENINAMTNVENKFLFDQFNVFEKADHYTKVTSWSEFKKHFFKDV